MSKVLVPDYFEDFHCKCGTCRHPCCDGWGINIDEREYFTLIGLDCDIRLRHKLDDAFVIEKNATPEAFAKIHPNYLEQCPMLDDDGLCLLQKEEGEGVMPLICRVYPRAVKKYGEEHEICMSCSCEETIELLMRSKEPLSLHETETEIPFDGMKIYGDEPQKQHIRHSLICAMSNTEIPIAERLGMIGNFVCEKELCREGTRLGAVTSLKNLLLKLMACSKSMKVCGDRVLEYLKDREGEELLSCFNDAERHLYRLIPDVESIAGRIIANHMLYESFPYSPDCESPDASFAAFCTAVALLKLLCVCGMADSDNIDDFTDILAFANRFIEHSDYYKICSRLDHPKGMEVYAKFAPALRKA